MQTLSMCAQSVCLNVVQVLLNCVKIVSCSFWVLVTINRMYIMIMCNAQRNKRVKRKKMPSIYVNKSCSLWSVGGSSGQHTNYTQTGKFVLNE